MNTVTDCISHRPENSRLWKADVNNTTRLEQQPKKTREEESLSVLILRLWVQSHLTSLYLTLDIYSPLLPKTAQSRSKAIRLGHKKIIYIYIYLKNKNVQRVHIWSQQMHPKKWKKTGIILTNFNRSECTDNTTNQKNKIYTFPPPHIILTSECTDNTTTPDKKW